MSMTLEQISKFVHGVISEGLIPGIDEREKKLVDYINDKFSALEKRLDNLESAGIKFCGTYNRASSTDYKRGSVVCFGGSSWIAGRDEPRGQPGSSDDWLLMAKRGSDGKNPR